jgi:hypothetical protein
VGTVPEGALSFIAMRRSAVTVALLVLATTGTAAAAKKKIQIVSKPAGASVYVGSLEAGEKCKTPCNVDVEAGDQVIVELEGYRPKSEAIVIGRRERAPYKRSYNLVPSVGTLKIDGPAGADVFVDGKEAGKLPYEADVTSGMHQVQVKLDGQDLYVDAVEVAEDEERKVTVDAKKKVAAKKVDDDEPEPTDPDDEPAIRKTAKPSAPREGSLFALSAALSVGFRSFEYRNVNPMTVRQDLGPESEGGQVLAGAQLELWPGRLAGVRLLRGFALVGRFQYGINSQTVIEDENNAALGARTFWTSLEVSARQQFLIADKLIAEVSLGYAGDQHQFEGLDSDIAKVPDAYYQSVKVGGRLALLVDKLEPYLAAENRVVLSGGPLAQRFDSTGGSDVSGFRGALGVGVKLGKITGRVEGSLTRYSWTFADNGMTDTSGAVDSIKQVSITAGYAY